MAAAVCSRLAAACSVREDRSILPCEISAVAVRTDSLLSRISISTVASLSANWLNARAICVTSSLPSDGRRLVRSPFPEPISSIASRTWESRRNAEAVMTEPTPAARKATATRVMNMACRTLRRPARASSSSMATTSSQSEFLTGSACSSLVAPPIFTANGCSGSDRLARAFAVRSADQSVAGLRFSLASGCATMRPLLSARKAKLAGVG